MNHQIQVGEQLKHYDKRIMEILAADGHHKELQQLRLQRGAIYVRLQKEQAEALRHGLITRGEQLRWTPPDGSAYQPMY